MPDDDISLSEKRMYGERRESTRAYVASGLGVATVDVSDDQIGRFGLEHRCTARDVAGGDGRLLVATDEDVLVGSGGEFEPAGFGPAVAVGVDGSLLAASEDGRVAELTDDEWVTTGRVDDVRAIDGDLVAAADGTYHLDDGLERAGLDDARDVAGDGRFAATATGVFRSEDGWDLETDGDATVVASEGDRAHAVVGGDLLERSRSGWWDAEAPDGEVVDVAYDDATVAVTADGAVLLDPVTAKDGATDWRTRSLGLDGVAGVAIP